VTKKEDPAAFVRMTEEKKRSETMSVYRRHYCARGYGGATRQMLGSGLVATGVIISMERWSLLIPNSEASGLGTAVILICVCILLAIALRNLIRARGNLC
jgi:hypothetical protein